MLRRFAMFSVLTGFLTALLMPTVGQAQAPPTIEDVEDLGLELFFDENLSIPKKQACVTCHSPDTGFTSSDSDANEIFGIHPGAIKPRFGARKPPSAAYAGSAGPLRRIPPAPFVFVEWEGGTFWDGRATGHKELDPSVQILGLSNKDILAEQALAPFLSDVEQNVQDKQKVIKAVARGDYADLFKKVWGEDSLDYKDDEVVEKSYDKLVIAIAAFERSDGVNPFTSKFDYWLKGEAVLTQDELDGLALFEGQGACSGCHLSGRDPNNPPLFTDFAYHNLGLPKNPDNPFYSMPKKINPDGADFIDRGLAQTLEDLHADGKLVPLLLPGDVPEDIIADEEGKFKTPTLRNVTRRPYPEFVKSYMHNGVFKSMEEVVEFYNKRDQLFPASVAEVPSTRIPPFAPVVNMGLTDEEEAKIVIFLHTLEDGYTP